MTSSKKVVKLRPDGKRVLSHKEAAAFLGVTPGYLYILRHRKLAPAEIPAKMLDTADLGARAPRIYYLRSTLVDWRKSAQAPTPRRVLRRAA